MLVWLLASVLRFIPPAAQGLSLVGDLADYSHWKRARFGKNSGPLLSHRERLWERMLPSLRERGPLSVVEFGVAWGYATHWWLSRLSDPDVAWHGFDTFTGLPTDWERGGRTIFEAGAFSAEGTFPDIKDARVHWHAGDIAHTIRELDWKSLRAHPLFLLLDFDMYVPTVIALESALPYLRVGDVLYFDEAYDAWNERKAIDELLLPKFSLRCIGSTGTALAIELADRSA